MGLKEVKEMAQVHLISKGPSCTGSHTCWHSNLLVFFASNDTIFKCKRDTTWQPLWSLEIWFSLNNASYILPYGIMGEWIRDLEFYKKVKKLFMGQGQLVVIFVIDIVEGCTSEMLSIL